MIITISSTFRNTNIRAVYLISYIQRGNGTDTAFHRTYSCLYMQLLDGERVPTATNVVVVVVVVVVVGVVGVLVVIRFSTY